MGQGLHQKMIQVVAEALEVEVNQIRVATNTSDVLGHMQTDTGGSLGSETNAGALLDACAKIKELLLKICEIKGKFPHHH